jgi:hypothetical protein
MEKIYNLEEKNKIIGEIYIIKNKINNMIYIGQTRSHVLNHKKYRPFGYKKRFIGHVNEANDINKKKQCTYLNNAIRKYGKDNFTSELIKICELDKLDHYEQKYIKKYNSLFPNGYNLTVGGKSITKYIIPTLYTDKIVKKGTSKSEETKLLISERLKSIKSNEEHRQKMMVESQKQFYDKKIERFINEKIDEDNLNKYLYEIFNSVDNKSYIRVKVGKQRSNFIGKYESIDEIKKKAINFLKDIIKQQHYQIAGNP